jgi:hypothetical protein
LKGPKERIDAKPADVLKLNKAPQPAAVEVPFISHWDVFEPPKLVVPKKSPLVVAVRDATGYAPSVPSKLWRIVMFPEVSLL